MPRKESAKNRAAGTRRRGRAARVPAGRQPVGGERAAGDGPAAAGAPLCDDQVTIGWLRDMMRAFVSERQWEKYHIPRNLAASVAVEAGELLELFQWLTGEEAAKKSREDVNFRRAVGEEMCDVMMYCISLANALDLPVAETIAAKMVKNRAKYPPERFRGHYERPIGQ